MGQTKRYRQIISTLLRRGFGWLLIHLGLQALVPFRWVLFGVPKHREGYTNPELLRLTFEELGVTFIKMAQILSTHPDIISPAYAQELSKLQDSVAPVPFEEIRPLLEAELGKPVKEIFRRFDPEPLASASIGQVYRARLHDGERVVVKVQKPGVAETIDQDLEVLEDIVQRIVARSEWGRKYDFEGLLDEFRFYLHNELEYLREGKNADRFREMFQDNPDIYIPKVYWEYTTSKVLVLEEIRGIKVTDLAECQDCGDLDRKKLALTAVEAIFDEIFLHGFYHADPHPGNFVIMSGGRVGLMDFGLVDYLDHKERESFLLFIYFMIRGQVDEMLEAMADLGIKVDDIRSRNALKRDLGHLLFRFRESTLREMAAGDLIMDLMSIAYRRQLFFPSGLAILFKVMAMTEGLGTILYPQFKFFEIAGPILEKQYGKVFSLARMVRKSQEEIYSFFQLDLPWRVMRLFKRIESGHIEVTVRHQTLSKESEKITRIIHSLTTSTLLTLYIIAFGLYLLAGNFLGFGHLLVNLLLALIIICGLYDVTAFIRLRRR